jgi:hypothetical protein
MAVVGINLVLPQGADFEQTFSLFNDGGQYFGITSYTVTSKLRKYYGSTSGITTFTTSIVDPTLGLIKLSLNETQTSSLTPGRYYYDILITSPSPFNITTKVVEGMILVEGTASL